MSQQAGAREKILLVQEMLYAIQSVKILTGVLLFDRGRFMHGVHFCALNAFVNAPREYSKANLVLIANDIQTLLKSKYVKPI